MYGDYVFVHRAAADTTTLLELLLKYYVFVHRATADTTTLLELLL